MKYENEPRPLVEEHYHIRELIESQEKRAADRTYHQNRIKQANEITDEINKAKPVEVKDFYCGTCKEDYRGASVKQVDSWSPIAFYRNKCRVCGTWSMRLITDRHRDEYYFKSKLVAYDRGKNALDLIQPNETNFNLLYGKR